jgi:ElaB/YqjD/DUF883 family membrane-anchored ribosome-binding protein
MAKTTTPAPSLPEYRFANLDELLEVVSDDVLPTLPPPARALLDQLLAALIHLADELDVMEQYSEASVGAELAKARDRVEAALAEYEHEQDASTEHDRALANARHYVRLLVVSAKSKPATRKAA